MRVAVLLFNPFHEYLEEELRSRFEVHRWYEIADHAAWLAQHGSKVRAVVTGGHIGITNEIMDRLPALGVVAINGVGFDKVDLDHAKSRGIRVSVTPDVLTDDVADLAVGLIVGLLRGIPAGDRFVREGLWPKGDRPLARKVTGRHFGILGLGRIGQAIARRLEHFGPISYADLVQKDVPYPYYADHVELARACDVLILASSANAATRNLVGRPVLDALGRDGYLVNVARGSLVDEPELIAALNEQRIAGAALDVFAAEPHAPEALRAMSNVVLTPHIASSTIETRVNMARIVLANLDAHFAGTPLPSALV